PSVPAAPAAVAPAVASAPASAPAPAPAPASAAVAVTGPAAAAGANGTRALDEQIQDLKKQTVALNRDLFILEEELLFPANTQVAVFVSVDVGDFFALDSITLKIDNREVSDYLYTPREDTALLKGGVQRLYVGNLKSGQHELVAFFNGKGPNNRYYRRAASIKFEKGVGAKYLELKITDVQHAQQPEFQIKDWE
ncbi:MAG: AraC family transcriptional regulator, partial [Steroidobacteraceae bacterium]